MKSAQTRSKPKGRITFRRSNRAFSLIEILVALSLSAVLTVLFVDQVAQIMRFQTASQHELCANLIAQEMTERARALGYTYLQSRQQNYLLLTNRTVLGQSGPSDISPGPVLLDLVNQIWPNTSAKDSFTCVSYLTVQPAPNSASDLQIVVTVNWFDSQDPNGRTIKQKSILTQSGEDKWAK